MLGFFGKGGGNTSDAGTHGRLDSANSLLTTLDNDLNAGLGTDGVGESPANGTGVRGWLRGIYDKLSGTLTVTASSLPLPSGAATSANQSTGNTSLATVATNSTTANTKLDTLHADLSHLTDGTQKTVKILGATAAPASVSTSTTSATLVSANANRIMVIITNNSTSAVLYVKYGATASTSSYTLQLQAGNTLIEDTYSGRIDAVLASGTDSAKVTEVTA